MFRLLLTLSLLLCLGACAPAVPVARPAPEAARLTADAVRMGDGAALHLEVWRPRGRPRAAILALHGYGDTAAGTFRWAAQDWARRGIVTYAYDQRGFGQNADRRRWPGPARLIADAQAVAGAVRRAEPGIPLVVIGHSMGGGVALAAAEGDALDADAVVLAAPAIAGGTEVDPVRRLGSLGLLLLAPDKRFTGEGLERVVRLFPTDNIAVLREVVNGPWHYSDPNGRELHGLLRLMDRAARTAPTVTLPVLTLMGAQDDYLRPRSVQAVQARIPGRAGFRLYPEGWHWLFRDLQAPLVWADVADFVLAQRPRPGAAAAARWPARTGAGLTQR